MLLAFLQGQPYDEGKDGGRFWSTERSSWDSPKYFPEINVEFLLLWEQFKIVRQISHNRILFQQRHRFSHMIPLEKTLSHFLCINIRKRFEIIYSLADPLYLVQLVGLMLLTEESTGLLCQAAVINKMVKFAPGHPGINTTTHPYWITG